jgi:hypothetical protein
MKYTNSAHISELLKKVLFDIDKERELIANFLIEIEDNLAYSQQLISLLDTHSNVELSYDYKDGEKFLALGEKVVLRQLKQDGKRVINE